MNVGEAVAAFRVAGLRSRGFSLAGMTGVMAAGLAADSTVFVMRHFGAAALTPDTSVVRPYELAVDWLHLHFVCLGAFTAPIAAGRRLSLRRGVAVAPTYTGGTDLDFVRDRTHSAPPAIAEALPAGQIATTTGLAVTGVTLETSTRARLLLAHCGAAGNDYDELWTFDDPLFLLADQTLSIIAPTAFDAGGTWQLEVKGHAKGL